MNGASIYGWCALIVAGVGILALIISGIVYTCKHRNDRISVEDPYVEPRPGEVCPVEWATHTFALSMFLGMSPTIYFECGKCRSDNQLKIPTCTVPEDNRGLPLRCQRCGTINRLPIKQV